MLAERIVADCQPHDQPPQDIVTALRFTGHLTEETPDEQLEKEQRHQRIAELAAQSSTDTQPIYNPDFAQAIAVAESFNDTSTTYTAALNYLRRLYTIYEHTSGLQKLPFSNSPSNDDYFMNILDRLVNQRTLP